MNYALFTAGLICVLSIPQCAVPSSLSNLSVQTTHSTAVLSFGVPAPTSILVRYGVTSDVSTASKVYTPGSAGTTFTRPLTGLRPGTQYFFSVLTGPANAAPSQAWQCIPGAGFTCVSETLGTFMTPEGAHHDPLPTVSVNTLEPVVNGERFIVKTDSKRICVDLQEQIQACSRAPSYMNHEILIPTGAVCKGRYTLPAKSGTGVCTIRTNYPLAEEKLDPKRDGPKLARIEVPFSYANLDTRSFAIGTMDTTATEGWRLQGLRITTEDPRLVKPQTWKILSIASDGAITLDTPITLTTHQMVTIAGVEGLTALNGVKKVSSTSGNTLRISPFPKCPTGNSCWVAGTGYVTRALGIPIQSMSATTPIVVKTKSPHALVNTPAHPIASIVTSTVALPDFNYKLHHSATIEGSSIAALNGTWPILRSGLVSGTVVLATPKTFNCASACGTVRARASVRVDASMVQGGQGTWLYDVLGPDSIELTGSSGSASLFDPNSGVPSLYQDPDSYHSLVMLNPSTKNVVIDRCWIDGRGFPNRVTMGVTLHGTNVALIRSHVDSTSWRMVDPRSNRPVVGTDEIYVGGGIGVDITRAKNAKIERNFIRSGVITIFAQDDTAALRPAENIEIVSNYLYAGPEQMHGSATSDGLYYPRRHHIEFKAGHQIRIDANVVDGNWVDFTPCGPAITFTPRGRFGKISDVSITRNIIKNSASGIQILGWDGFTPEVTARFLIADNYFNIDHYTWTSRTRAVEPGLCGYAVNTMSGIEDLEIRNNTAVGTRGKGAQFFSFFTHDKGEGVRVHHNLFSHTIDHYSGAITPAFWLGFSTSTSNRVGWESVFANSTFADNMVIPEVTYSNDINNYSNAARTVKLDVCRAFYKDFSNVTCVGTPSTTETSLMRRAMIGYLPTSPRLSPVSGHGADLGALDGLLAVPLSAALAP